MKNSNSLKSNEMRKNSKSKLISGLNLSSRPLPKTWKNVRKYKKKKRLRG
jgi:hypothetical protein